MSRTSAHPKQPWQRGSSGCEWNNISLPRGKKSGYWSRCFYGNWYNFILVMDYTGKLQGGLRWWSSIWQSLAESFSGVIRQFWFCFTFYTTIYNHIVLYFMCPFSRAEWGSSAQLCSGGCSAPARRDLALLRVGSGCQHCNHPRNFVFAHFWTQSSASDKIWDLCFKKVFLLQVSNTGTGTAGRRKLILFLLRGSIFQSRESYVFPGILL